MYTSSCLRFFSYSTLTLCLLGLAGCGEPAAPSASNNNELKQLGSEYMDYFRTRQQTPPNEEEFKAFIQGNLSDVKKELLGITDPNKMFVSQRDNQPFVVRYGIKLAGGAGGPGAAGPSADGEVAGEIVIYEASGGGGTRQAFTTLGQLVELSLDDLKKRVPDAK